MHSSRKLRKLALLQKPESPGLMANPSERVNLALFRPPMQAYSEPVPAQWPPALEMIPISTEFRVGLMRMMTGILFLTDLMPTQADSMFLILRCSSIFA